MAILILSSPLPAQPFAEALQVLAPQIAVWTSIEEAVPERVEALLAWRLKPGLLPLLPRLRVLCSTGAGVDKLMVDDLPAALPVTRIVDPEQAMQISQYVLACTLRFTRDLPLYAAQQSRAEWRRHPVRPAGACRIGLLGFGAVGQAVARAFSPLGYPVAAWARRQRDDQDVTLFSGRDGLAALLARTDILVNTLPLTPETHGLLSRDTLSVLPRGAYVINVGRGEHLVEADLQPLLDDGSLAGAALDVFEREPPPPGHWLWSHPGVLATPHIAAQASAQMVAAQCLDALQRARDGLPQPYAVDRAAGY